MSFADIEKIGELGQKAKDGKITIEDLQLEHSQSLMVEFMDQCFQLYIKSSSIAVLGMHNIIQRPVVVDGKVEVRPIMCFILRS